MKVHSLFQQNMDAGTFFLNASCIIQEIISLG